jgi:RNA-binding protein YhbY
VRIEERIRIRERTGEVLLFYENLTLKQSQTTALQMTPLIKINVGGTLFETRRQLFERLEEETPLRLMVLGPVEADAEAEEGSA